MPRRDSHMKIKIKYLSQDVDRHGNIRMYVRRPGHAKIRIQHAVGSDAFWEEYNAALAGGPLRPSAGVGKQLQRSSAPRTRAGSLRALCELYRASPEFKALGVRTRGVRQALLESICLSAISNGTHRGDLPYREMETRHVRDVRNAWADNGVEAANSRLKALRQMFAWAVDNEHAARNPARDVGYFKGNPDGFHTWTMEEVERYRERHPVGSKGYLALALLSFTGTRRCDVVTLGPQLERNGWLHFTEAKGRGRHIKQRSIPVLPELRAAIEASPSGHLAYLVTAYGKPFTANGFGNWFRDRCNEAGLPHCSAHGLRKAGATIAAENGATEKQLMAIFGWESMKQAELYTRQANRTKMVGDAMHLIARRKQAGNDFVPPDRGVEKGETNPVEIARKINGG